MYSKKIGSQKKLGFQISQGFQKSKIFQKKIRTETKLCLNWQVWIDGSELSDVNCQVCIDADVYWRGCELSGVNCQMWIDPDVNWRGCVLTRVWIVPTMLRSDNSKLITNCFNYAEGANFLDATVTTFLNCCEASVLTQLTTVLTAPKALIYLTHPYCIIF